MHARAHAHTFTHVHTLYRGKTVHIIADEFLLEIVKVKVNLQFCIQTKKKNHLRIKAKINTNFSEKKRQLIW